MILDSVKTDPCFAELIQYRFTHLLTDEINHVRKTANIHQLIVEDLNCFLAISFTDALSCIAAIMQCERIPTSVDRTTMIL